METQQKFGDRMLELDRTRHKNKFHLDCPNCDFELMSISAYKQMERELVRDGEKAKEDCDGPDLTYSEIGFCWNCGGFVHWLDYSDSHSQHETAKKAFNYRVSRSVGQSRSNKLRPFVKNERNRRWNTMTKDEDGHFRRCGEPNTMLDEPDPDSKYRDKSLNPEWIAWYDQAKKHDLIHAKNRMDYEEWCATDEGKAQQAKWKAEREAE